MDFTPDPELRFRALEYWVLDLLAVPSAPEPPDGSPESIRVFQAGRNYYVWSVLVWASRSAAVFAGLAAVSVAGTSSVSEAPGWMQVAWLSLIGLGWIVFILTVIVTFIARRRNYRLRWYIVTDRSLRIRIGVFRVNELTMTFGNIQEIRDLIVEHFRRYRDSGLGDAPLRAAASEPSEIAAARKMLEEARALRASLARDM